MAQRIQKMLDGVSARITSERYDDVAHYIGQHEWELAVLMMGEYLDEQDSKLSATEFATFNELAEEVGIARGRFHYLQAGTP